MDAMTQTLSQEMHTIYLLILAITAIVHILFAGAVAKDAGDYLKNIGNTHLVSGAVWAFATLVGGVIVAAIYWFMHRVSWQKRL